MGGSWKLSRPHSIKQKRILHGKESRGRFRAFSLGRVVDWDVRAADRSGALQRYRISIIKDHLRCIFASRSLALGESLTMIEKLLGHTRVQTTARYAHLARDSIQTAASRITGSIGGNLLGGDEKNRSLTRG